MDLQGLGRILLLIGVGMVVVGGLFLLGARLGIGSLPGTVRVQGQSWSCYVPIVASLVLSILLTIVINVILRLFR